MNKTTKFFMLVASINILFANQILIGSSDTKHPKSNVKAATSSTPSAASSVPKSQKKLIAFTIVAVSLAKLFSSTNGSSFAKNPFELTDSELDLVSPTQCSFTNQQPYSASYCSSCDELDPESRKVHTISKALELARDISTSTSEKFKALEKLQKENPNLKQVEQIFTKLKEGKVVKDDQKS